MTLIHVLSAVRTDLDSARCWLFASLGKGDEHE